MLPLLLSLQAIATAPPPTPQTVAEAWAADARTYADRFGVPLAQAQDELWLQEATVALSDRLAARWSARLAGILVDRRPRWRLVVVLTGDAPVPTEFADVAGHRVEIEYRTGAAATRATLLAAIDRLGSSFRAALPHPPGLGIDARRGRLVVLIRGDDVDPGGEDATSARLQTIAGVPVKVLTWAESDRDLQADTPPPLPAPAPATRVFGGSRVIGPDPADGRRYVCTTGFAVTDGPRTGIATAAHCPDALTFVARDGARVPLTLAGAWGSMWRDVQIHLAPQPPAPLFRADDEDRPRPLTSWRLRPSTRVGDFVCHRGERTGYSCSVVDFADFAPPGDLCAGPCPATWVAVRGPRCRSGDSGGPVFMGTIAFGLIKGASYTADGTCRLYYYMSTDYLPPPWRLRIAQPSPARDEPSRGAVPAATPMG